MHRKVWRMLSSTSRLSCPASGCPRPGMTVITLNDGVTAARRAGLRACGVASRGLTEGGRELIKTFLLRFFTWWNGQTFGTQLSTWLYGEFVGEDEFGNRY